jgi:hypothetical protein
MIKEYLSDHARVEIDDNGVIQSIKPDSHLHTNLSDTIQNYVLDELVYFINKNHISKRAWKKHGAIIRDVEHIDMFIYQFVYKTRFRTVFNEIKFSYNILKQER